MTLKKILVSTAAVLTLGAALTACSTDDQSGNSGDSQAVNAEQGAFPTTIEHRYGSTEIKEAQSVWSPWATRIRTHCWHWELLLSP